MAREERALWEKEASARCTGGPEQRLACKISLHRYSGADLRAQRLQQERAQARQVAESEAAAERARQEQQTRDEARRREEQRLAEERVLEESRRQSLVDLIWLGVDAYVAGGGDQHVLRRVQEQCAHRHSVSPACVEALFDDDVRSYLAGRTTFFGPRLEEAVKPLRDLALEPLPLGCDLKALTASIPAEQAKQLYCVLFFEKGGAKPRVEDVVRRQRQRMRAYRSTEGFGQTRWGMGPRDVRRVERVRPAGQDLVGSVEVAGRRAVPRWIFHDGVLVSVELSVESRVMAGPLDDFFDLQALLSIKYGEPKEGSQLQADRASLALQVLGGEQELTTWWTTEDTFVELRASRNGTSVLYACRTLWGWHVAERQKRLAAEASKL